MAERTEEIEMEDRREESNILRTFIQIVILVLYPIEFSSIIWVIRHSRLICLAHMFSTASSKRNTKETLSNTTCKNWMLPSSASLSRRYGNAFYLKIVVWFIFIFRTKILFVYKLR